MKKKWLALLEKIAALIMAFICTFGLTGCVPAPGDSGPGRRQCAKYITPGPGIVEDAG